jgi:cytoskeletal protein RodZ
MTFSIRILNTSVLAAAWLAAFQLPVRAANYEMPKTKAEADAVKKAGQRKCLEHSSNMQSYAATDGMSAEEKIVRGELQMEQERNKQLCDEQADLDSQVIKRMEEIEKQKSRLANQENALKNTKAMCYANSLPITEIETAAVLNKVTIVASGLTTVAGGISIWQNVKQRNQIKTMTNDGTFKGGFDPNWQTRDADAAAKAEADAAAKAEADAAGGGKPVTPQEVPTTPVPAEPPVQPPVVPAAGAAAAQAPQRQVAAAQPPAQPPAVPAARATTPAATGMAFVQQTTARSGELAQTGGGREYKPLSGWKAKM